MNKADQCVWNKIDPDTNEQITICVYVDDLLITCASDTALDSTICEIDSKFESTTVERGPTLSYLGVQYDFTSEETVSLSMSGYVREIIEEYEVTGHATSPATEDLFKANEESERLDKGKSDMFHSRVAKLLYLSKRVRPDLLTAIAYLSTRVQCSTEDDWSKLERVLKYLNKTKDLVLTLKCNSPMTILASIDASYAVHRDLKSHSGISISFGSGTIYAESTKQKLVTKSSTEAELVALNDGLAQVLWLSQFLQEQGIKVNPAIIFQDNKSTIQLANNGPSSSKRTKHINIRYYFVKEKVDNGEIIIQYTPTSDMVSDVLTKPLNGSHFVRLRDLLLNKHLGIELQ